MRCKNLPYKEGFCKRPTCFDVTDKRASKATISGEERATALRTVGAIPADFCVTKLNQYSFCL